MSLRSILKNVDSTPRNLGLTWNEEVTLIGEETDGITALAPPAEIGPSFDFFENEPNAPLPVPSKNNAKKNNGTVRMKKSPVARGTILSNDTKGSNEQIVNEGYLKLLKQVGMKSTWTRRYIRLSPAAFSLFRAPTTPEAIKRIDLNKESYVVEISNIDGVQEPFCGIKLISDGKTFILKAADRKELSSWLSCFCGVIDDFVENSEPSFDFVDNSSEELHESQHKSSHAMEFTDAFNEDAIEQSGSSMEWIEENDSAEPSKDISDALTPSKDISNDLTPSSDDSLPNVPIHYTENFEEDSRPAYNAVLHSALSPVDNNIHKILEMDENSGGEEVGQVDGVRDLELIKEEEEICIPLTESQKTRQEESRLLAIQKIQEKLSQMASFETVPTDTFIEDKIITGEDDKDEIGSKEEVSKLVENLIPIAKEKDVAPQPKKKKKKKKNSKASKDDASEEGEKTKKKRKKGDSIGSSSSSSSSSKKKKSEHSESSSSKKKKSKKSSRKKVTSARSTSTSAMEEEASSSTNIEQNIRMDTESREVKEKATSQKEKTIGIEEREEREAKQNRLAAKLAKEEEKRIAEEAKLAAELAKEEEEERFVAATKAAEEKRIVEEAEEAEEAKLAAELAKEEEEERLVAATKAAEEKRIAEEAEEAEEAKLAAELAKEEEEERLVAATKAAEEAEKARRAKIAKEEELRKKEEKLEAERRTKEAEKRAEAEKEEEEKKKLVVDQPKEDKSNGKEAEGLDITEVAIMAEQERLNKYVSGNRLKASGKQPKVKTKANDMYPSEQADRSNSNEKEKTAAVPRSLGKVATLRQMWEN